MDEHQQELQGKLNDLKIYEELERNHIIMQSQNTILSKEQKQMYEILGISLSSFNERNYETENIDVEKEFEEIPEIEHEDDDDDSDDEGQNSSHLKEYNNELVNSSLERDNDDKQERSSEQQVVKKPFLKRGVGLTTRFRIPPDKFNLKKLPRYKYQDRLQKTLSKQKGFIVNETKSDMPKKAPTKKPDAPKITKSPTEKQDEDDLSIPKNIKLKVPSEIKPSPPHSLSFEKLLQKSQPHDIEETPKQSKLPKGTSWAQILSANNINDCSINMDQLLNVDEMTQNDLDGTNLFQLLEERIKNLESSPVSILSLLASLQNKQNNVDENDPIIENAEAVCLHLNPHPDQLTNKIVIDESEASFDQESEDETQESDHRVRFAENVQILQHNQEETRDDTANSSILSNDNEAVELLQTSTPNERQKFEDFKLKLLGRQVQQDDLKGKVDLLKLKLEDIEREKGKIIQMRSNLELERVQFENERDDLIGQMRDERMKMEMEMHDERVKIDQQKQKYDKLMRDGKNQSSKKEREEIVKLKEAIEELKEEMKNKEARHASTSARYRTQIKQLEKDNQTLKLELEVATKDNKRMEVENARLKRDTSNKMLQEINKNIAKLVNPDSTKIPEEKKKVEAPLLRKKNGPTVNSRKSNQNIPKPKEITSSSEESDNEDAIVQSKTHNTLKTRLSAPQSKSPSSSDAFSEMKREIVNSNGSKDIWYPNGNLKKISSDGMLIRMLYYNKDIKETNINEGTVKYYYADNNTWHTTYIDGLEILEYPNNQIEHRSKDGTIEIHHSDGSIRITNKNWTDDLREEWRMNDGTNVKVFKNDTKILSFPNGQREVHTLNHKRREYPDGTVKLMYEDGTMETRYSNGRVRVKDKDGNLLSDNNITK